MSPFSRLPGFDLDAEVATRAEALGIELADGQRSALAAHARAVIGGAAALHLTSITEPMEFLDRHLGEALVGAAMLPAAIEGLAVDLGSGNGYPGLPICIVRPGLRAVLVESSRRRADFLRALVERTVSGSTVLHASVQHARDLASVGPVRLLLSRAMRGWDRIVPRVAACLGPDGELLLWAGGDMESVARRKAWQTLQLLERHPLPGRDRSWIWRFGVSS